jgi:hypothetical protein
MYKKVKRPFTILEALLSMLLVSIAIIPLIRPYTFIFSQEKRIIEELEADRIAHILFVDTIAKLLRKEMSLPPYAKGERVPVENQWSDLVQYNIYTIWEDEAHLYQVSYIFEPKNPTEKGRDTLDFHFILPEELFSNEKA